MATTTSQVVETKQDVDTAVTQRVADANAIARRNIYWAMGIGVVPAPIVDFIGITAVQVKMLKELSERYEISFSEHKVKNIVSSLLVSTLSVGTGAALAFSLLKIVPGVGSLAGVVAVPIAAGALTYATSKVFIQHFESGGTFLDFDPKKVRQRFRDEFEKGKEYVTRIKTETKPS